MTRLVSREGTVVDVEGDTEARLVSEGWTPESERDTEEKPKQARAPRAKSE